METFKQIVRVASVIAGLAFLRAPFTSMGLVLMALSAVVALACFAAYKWSEPEDAEADNSN